MKIFQTILLVSATAVSSMALAEQEKEISQIFDIASSNKLSIDFPVGTVDLQAYQGDKVTVEILLKEKDLSWFDREPDFDNITLKSYRRNGTLSLEINDDDLEQEWVVKVPEQMALSIDLGVGEVDIEYIDNDLSVDVGVGSVSVNVKGDAYGDIDLDSGVGATKIRGLEGRIKNERAMVSSTSKLSGDGQYQMSIDVGVGDAKVRSF